MRIPATCAVALTIVGLSCVKTPTAGLLGEGATSAPKLVAIDTTRPPKTLSVQLDRSAYAAVLLVAPGHSATLLYPRDSLTDNKLAAGTSVLSIDVPGVLVRNDSVIVARRASQRREQDSLLRRGSRSRAQRTNTPAPIPPATLTYLLLVTSPQPLSYSRILTKTAGVSIPLIELEALNAVGKAIKSTLASEPREWAGFYQRIELSPMK